MKAVQYLKKKEFDKQLNTLKTTTYYWRAIPKDQLTEEYVQEEIDNDDLVKRGVLIEILLKIISTNY